MRNSKLPFFIDALPFAQPRKSGVGHITEGMTLGLAQLLKERGDRRRIYLVVPLRKAKYVRKYVNETIRIKTIPLPAKVLHALNKLNLLPPMDIFLGRGNYIFSNYRNWRLLSSKSFTYIHDLSFVHYEKFTEPKNLTYLKKNVPLWIRRADFIVTASEYTKREIVAEWHVDSERVYVIPHGVDMTKFSLKQPSRTLSVLRSYGIDETGYILHVGNIEPRKNIRGLLEAYAQMPRVQQENHAILLVGGDGWQNKAEKRAIREGVRAGLRILHPNRYVEDADLPSFYSAASVLVMPSFYEGFGMPPLQAMACGAPVVVGDNSSLREYFGKVAVLVDPNDTTSIRKGLKETLSMKDEARKQYQVAARKLARQLSWKNTATILLRMIDEVGL